LPRAYHLRGRLRLVISLLVALVLVSGATTVLTGLSSGRAIQRAHELEATSRRAALLSVVAREQYIHEAHTIILRDHSHVSHHDEWVRKLGTELRELRPDVDAEGGRRLDAIGEASRALTELFSARILPAIDRHDWAEVRGAHEEANALVDRMTEQADALADYFDDQATEAERAAASLIRFTCAVAVALLAVAAALALIAARSLWRSFSTPLASLERVAERVATGDRQARIAPVGAVELAVVADSFNRMLDALVRAEAELVASARLSAIGRVASGVAHEINNPIAIIRGYVKTMRQEAESPTLREELQILDEEAAACQRIAEELLVYARSPAMEPVPVEAAELLEDAAERCRLPAEEPGAPPLIVEAEPAQICVDPLRIRQVLVNLVANAREATAGAEPVIVRGSRRGDGYRIEVLDRGKGLSVEAREHLFEPFFTTRRDGTGLGLAVCYGLVTAHGGTIQAEPRPEGGARFVIDLPGVVVDGEEPEARERA
jgi:signal transduction histidine kinase